MTDGSPIRVMLVDDHAVVRSGLSAFLLAYDDLELVGEAADGAEAVRMCERLHPDVILMDLIMPRMDGATATRAIRERSPQVQVLALTSFKEDNLIQDVLKAGAIGYLMKNISADELAAAIRAARRGRATLAPEAAQALIDTATKHGKISAKGGAFNSDCQIMRSKRIPGRGCGAGSAKVRTSRAASAVLPWPPMPKTPTSRQPSSTSHFCKRANSSSRP